MGLRRVFIRSDKAACYHNSMLFRNIHAINERHGNYIKRWDFSEPQSGKSSCDRHAARIKQNIRRAVNERGNCRTPVEFVRCITNSEVPTLTGLKGVITLLGDVENRDPLGPKHTIRGVSQLNNFEFGPDGITAWKAYGIGPEVRHDYSEYRDRIYNAVFTVKSHPTNERPEIWYENQQDSPTLLTFGHSFWRPIETTRGCSGTQRARDQEAQEWTEMQREMEQEDAACPTEGPHHRLRHKRRHWRHHSHLRQRRLGGSSVCGQPSTLSCSIAHNTSLPQINKQASKGSNWA